MLLEYQGYTYIINKLDYETQNSLISRSWFAVKQNPKDQTELNKNLKIGKLYTNQKYLGCKYNQKINNIINNKLS
tara:strand:- start:292 stop:516 length:225 start_codon:yes stop_codon:yes gene_type:complete